MALARCWHERRDELVADFQQVYGLNAFAMGLDSDEDSPEVERAAILLSQLPSKSRVFERDDPDLGWDTDVQFLRLIEHELRALIWVLGRGKGKRPKPIDTPSERRRKERAIDTAEEQEREVAAILADILPAREHAADTEGGDG